jgi:hypothetical protein
MDRTLPKIAAHGRLTRVLSREQVLARRRGTQGWRRRAGLLPWRRGRIRPTTCRDHAAEK